MKKLFKASFFSLALLLFTSLFSTIVLAQAGGGGGSAIHCSLRGCQKNTCNNCACPDRTIYTGLGCIPVEPTAFAGWFLGWAIGIAGGLAFLLILYGGFRVITSAGNPEQLQGGKELITSAIAGLLIIIFSLFLLRLIGVGILQLPGFPGV